MKTRITDLFKHLRNRVKNFFKEKPKPIKYEHVKVQEFTPIRKKPPSRWIISHNMIQAKNANELKKRRAKNKMASKSRKINNHKHKIA